MSLINSFPQFLWVKHMFHYFFFQKLCSFLHHCHHRKPKVCLLCATDADSVWTDSKLHWVFKDVSPGHHWLDLHIMYHKVLSGCNNFIIGKRVFVQWAFVHKAGFSAFNCPRTRISSCIGSLLFRGWRLINGQMNCQTVNDSVRCVCSRNKVPVAICTSVD